MGFVSFFYYYYFSEVDDNRSAVVIEVVMEEKKEEKGEREWTWNGGLLYTRIGISNTNDKNVQL